MTIKTKKWDAGEYYTIQDMPIDHVPTTVWFEINKEGYEPDIYWLFRIYEYDPSDPEFPRGQLLSPADDVYETKREAVEAIEWLMEKGMVSDRHGLVIDM